MGERRVIWVHLNLGGGLGAAELVLLPLLLLHPRRDAVPQLLHLGPGHDEVHGGRPRAPGRAVHAEDVGVGVRHDGEVVLGGGGPEEAPLLLFRGDRAAPAHVNRGASRTDLLKKRREEPSQENSIQHRSGAEG